jgi:hypothetical protein
MRAAATLAVLLLAAPRAAAQSQSRVKPDTAAADVLGNLDTHARAISCTNGGWFESLRVNAQDGRIAGLELCCAGKGSNVWYEGSSPDTFTEACFWVGQADDQAAGARRRAPALSRRDDMQTFARSWLSFTFAMCL